MIDLKYVTQERKVFFDIAKKMIFPDFKVLDIGAGDGSFARYCNRKDFYLFDANKESFRKLTKEFPNTYYGRLPELPFKHKFFDLIHISHVVEHLDSETLYNT